MHREPTHGCGALRRSVTQWPTFVLARRQSGMALIVTLMLLAILALAGLTTLRSALMQQRMSAYQYDRHVAFERAEAALRTAQQRVADGVDDNAVRHCESSGSVCYANPFADPRLPAGSIRPAASGGQAQYVVECMGSWVDGEPAPGKAPATMTYYRLTARSSAPMAGDRAVVMLQAIVRRPAAADGSTSGSSAERVSWREQAND